MRIRGSAGETEDKAVTKENVKEKIVMKVTRKRH